MTWLSPACGSRRGFAGGGRGSGLLGCGAASAGVGSGLGRGRRRQRLRRSPPVPGSAVSLVGGVSAMLASTAAGSVRRRAGAASPALPVLAAGAAVPPLRGRLAGFGRLGSFGRRAVAGARCGRRGDLGDAAVELRRVGPVRAQIVGDHLLEARTVVIGVLGLVGEDLVAVAALRT